MTRCLAVVLLLLVGVAGMAAEKKPKKAFLGVMIGPGKDKGSIVIMAVIGDSPAEKAGLKVGDVLVRIDGAKPADLRAAVQVVRSLKPGKKVKFEIVRDGKRREIAVIPGELE